MDRRIGSLRPSVLVVVAVVVLVAVGIALAWRSEDSGTPEDLASSQLVDAASFASLIEAPQAFLVNVHIPYEGEIEGTDLFIPYDEIMGDDRLPSDPGTPLLIYCRSGRMSAIAAAALVDAGYTDVSDLEGGMVAWEADGRPIVESSGSS